MTYTETYYRKEPLETDSEQSEEEGTYQAFPEACKDEPKEDAQEVKETFTDQQ